MNTFIDLVRMGKADPDDIDNYVDAWHDSGPDETRKLHEFLGMTWDEYARWVEDPTCLRQILDIE